jgi:GNAT superfamily N-acetyltransferase
MTIRPGTAEDLPAIVAMGRDFLAASPYAPHFAENQVQMQALATQLIAADTAAILVAEQDGAIVGMLGIIASPHFISGEMTAGEVFWWVDPAHRGGGVRLLRAAEAWAQARGAVAMQMIAPNDRVGEFYERVGYQPIERTFIRRLDAA